MGLSAEVDDGNLKRKGGDYLTTFGIFSGLVESVKQTPKQLRRMMTILVNVSVNRRLLAGTSVPAVLCT